MGCKLTDKPGKVTPKTEDVFDFSIDQLWHNNGGGIDWFLANLILSDLHFICNCYK